MAPTIPQFKPARLRSYLLHLPLFTRLILLLLVTLWLASLQSVWDVAQWGALIPKEVGLSTMYRLNTYPLIHVNLLHALLNSLALTPLLERFESEHGTLTTAALLAGPLSTLPAGLYLLFERGIWRGNNAIMGASLWVFVFLAVEAIKAYGSNPYFAISTYQVPTWITPAIITLLVTFLIPNTSLLGHLCALSVGYLFGLGYLKILAPPEKIIRWIEGKMNLLGRLPHYVSVDQKTYGRYGVLPSSTSTSANAAENGVSMTYVGSNQRLGP
ncbi:MAG: putative rhomboid protease [Candelaria pacifica]|nr:MAG: putative rhomboid protease [Candelaria pacifica]